MEKSEKESTGRPVGRGIRRGAAASRVSPGSSSPSASGHQSSGTPRGSSSPTTSSRSPGSGGSPRRSPTEILQEHAAELEIEDLLPRPGYCTVGREVQLRANYFRVRLPETIKAVHQYNVSIKHPSDRKMDRDETRKVFWTLVTEICPEKFSNRYGLAYDGMSALYSLDALSVSTEGDKQPTVVNMEVPVRLPKDPREQTKLRVVIIYVGMKVLDMSLARIGNVENRDMTPVQILDIVMRQGLAYPFGQASKVFYPFQSSFYRLPTPSMPAAMDLGSGKELWAGFFTAVHIGEKHLPILNVDVSHTMFYKMRMPMIEFMCDVLNEKAGSGPLAGGGRGGRGGGRGGGYSATGQSQAQGPYQTSQITGSTRLSHADVMALNDAMKGLKVRVSHRENIIRVYRVNSVVDAADSLNFEVKTVDAGGNETRLRTNVADYFATRYEPLRFPALPCLHVGPIQRNIYFPIEVCEVETPQKVAKKPNEAATAAIIRATASPADVRQRKIQDLLTAARYQDDPFLQQFGITVDQAMVQVPARVLPPPNIIYSSQNNPMPRVQPRDGAWDSMRQRLLSPAECAGYSMIALLPPREEQTLQNFCAGLHSKAVEMGMKFPQWPTCVKYGRTKEDVESAFRECLAEHKMKDLPCDMIIIIMSAKNSDIYMTAKEMSDMQYGVMSQCLLYKNISKNSPATCSNIVLKLNTKLGGVNNQLEADQVSSKYLVNSSTMIVGIDVTHPTIMEEKQGMPSIASIVANIDTLPMKYGANVKVQKHCRESVVYLMDSIRERLVAFYKATKIKPERIIVYRDGVSEGQFMEVLREELRGIRMAGLMLAHDYKPKITFIIVNKRHHARFFPSNPSEACGRAKNVHPGTVVDRRVISPEAFDFYLNSHQGIQGTCRPARYTVLSDDSKFTADEIQLLTYQLCHTYCRCPRAVSIPAPVYYAHLVAARSRYHVKRRLGVRDSDSMSDAGKSGRGALSSADSAIGDSSEAGTPSSSRGRGRGRGSSATRAAETASSESGLQDSVNVADVFKNRMYFV